jgi:hypothetical protein
LPELELWHSARIRTDCPSRPLAGVSQLELRLRCGAPAPAFDGGELVRILLGESLERAPV